MKKLNLFLFFLFLSFFCYSINLNIYQDSKQVINETLSKQRKLSVILKIFWTHNDLDINNLLYDLSYFFSNKGDFLNFKKREYENPIRRAEILFFGTLTFSSFGAWLFFSLYNFLIYNEPFGRLRREQFLILYSGCTVVSISVILTDLFLANEKKFKNFSIY